ncbi:MAG: methylmalonyl-CoA mutase, partial [Chloroflexi bacterium]|nr:methylmalonyl-CoA mutase [Chloroflexota bacterium]
VLGVAQTLSFNTYEELMAKPTQAAATYTLRTQHIILHETDAAAVIDPLGGSYCVEALTDQIEQEVRSLLEELEAMPGDKAWERMSDEAHDAGYQRQRAVDAEERIVVGVNRFRMEEEDEEALGLRPGDSFEYDPGWRDKQIARLEKVKRERDPGQVEAARARLVKAYSERSNIVPPMIEAVKANLSIGEISELLAGVHGWEELRQRRGFAIGLLY